MKLSRILLAMLAISTLVALAAAQDSSQYQPQKPSAQNPPSYAPDAPPSPDAPPVYTPSPSTEQRPYVPPPAEVREWVPQGIASLGQYAATRTEFTIDHSMLVLASKLDRDREDLRRVIAGVNGVSVHSFHYPGAVSLDPLTMSSISQEYRDAGFQHLVSKHRGDSGLTTDLWLRMEGATVRDIAVLWAGSRDVNFISVSGSITPLDLLHLSGHFGIPRMDGGAVLPAPRR
jgi:hypothetical protein